MTTSQAKEKIQFYTNTFLSIVGKSIKEDINALEAGRLALKLIGCPLNVALEIERLMLIELNK